MKKPLFFIIGTLIAILFWLFDSSIHYIFYGEKEFELIPDEINKLWMRLTIVILIVSFGLFADCHSNKVLNKEKQLEALKIYSSTLFATHHILNNLLNQMQLFKMEALKCNDFDQDMLEYYDVAIQEATELIEKLSSVEVISDENIKNSIYPK